MVSSIAAVLSGSQDADTAVMMGLAVMRLDPQRLGKLFFEPNERQTFLRLLFQAYAFAIKNAVTTVCFYRSGTRRKIG